MTDRRGSHDFVYVHTDIPAGMTIREWRRAARRRPRRGGGAGGAARMVAGAVGGARGSPGERTCSSRRRSRSSYAPPTVTPGADGPTVREQVGER